MALEEKLLAQDLVELVMVLDVVFFVDIAVHLMGDR